MTAADLMRICLEFDQKCISSRPSSWGKAALLIQKLIKYALHADPNFNKAQLGDWQSVDTSQVDHWRPPTLDQPTLALAEQVEALRVTKADLLTALNRIAYDPIKHAEASHAEILEECELLARAAIAKAKSAT